MKYVKLKGALGERWFDPDLLETLRGADQLDVGVLFLVLSLLPKRADTAVFDTYHFRERDGALVYDVPPTTTRFVLVPAYGKQHFCLTIFDKLIRVVYTVDSLTALGLSEDAFEAIRKRFPSVAHQPVRCPVQKNDYDCGVWALTAALLFLEGREAFESAPHDVDRVGMYEFVAGELQKKTREFGKYESLLLS